MAKIAVELARAVTRREVEQTPIALTSRVLAQGDGWSVSDVVCTAGPRDRSLEEKHMHYSIAVVAAGTFQYRGGGSGERFSRQLLTPGSLMLGSPRQCFECGHEHHAGDRCIGFWYHTDFFERMAGGQPFGALRLPPLQATAPLVTQACVGISKPAETPWDELAVRLARQTIDLMSGISIATLPIPLSAEARVTRAVRLIDNYPDSKLSLGELAAEARLSPYHFLRVFEGVTGLTPHQYVRRARLREAAVRVASEPTRILEIALDCGFGDVSNFNRAFRGEFGVSPQIWRKKTRAPGFPRGK